MGMTGFWVVMGAMIALGLVFVLLPLTRRHHLPDSLPRFQSNMLIHRDQLKQLEIDRDKGAISADEFQSEQQELARRAIEDALAALKEVPPRSERPDVRPVAIALAILVPAAAIGLYLKLGSPDSLAVNKASPLLVNTQDQTSPHGMSFDQIRESADKLSARLRENPSDGEGWAMLARSYNVLGRYQEAAMAYEKAVSLLPRDAQLMADQADALAMSQGQKMEGKPLEIVRQALKIDSTNLKALALAGTAAFDRKEYGEAVKYWDKVVQLAPADSEFARSIVGNLEEARALAEGRTPVAALPQIMPEKAENAPARAPAAITGSISLKRELAARVKPDDTVFIFARAEKGPRMPLAILQRKASELPISFSLDDSSAMSPNMKLSSAAAVNVVARISRSGNATAQSGDLEGMAGPVKPGSQGIQISIGNVVP